VRRKERVCFDGERCDRQPLSVGLLQVKKMGVQKEVKLEMYQKKEVCIEKYRDRKILKMKSVY
jgi:hypothetical protein